MELYFAPLEGITDALFRKIHHRCYPGADRYYTPFFSPTVHRSLTPREHRELPRVEKGDPLVIPQLLTKNAEDFLWAAGQCAERGYTEVNLNAGCPSGTVFSKGKGAGMLSDPDSLDRFLDTVFASTPLPISVKARIGVADPAEFPALLAVFNRYPICRLILHPRVRKAFYTGTPDMERFSYAVSHSKAETIPTAERSSQQLKKKPIPLKYHTTMTRKRLLKAQTALRIFPCLTITASEEIHPSRL